MSPPKLVDTGSGRRYTERLLPMNKRDFSGYWRITDNWDQGTLDLVEPAHLSFSDRRGHLSMIAIEAGPDCRYEGGRVEFSLFGADEFEPIAGRGWATVDGSGRMNGTLYFHDRDETDFTAERAEAPASPKASPQRHGRRW